MSTPPQQADDLLIERARRGDADAIDAWYRREHPTVWRLCLGFLADATEADDLAQDAMLRLLDSLDTWNPSRRWSAWRNTIVLNLCRDRRRRLGTRRVAESGAANQPVRALPSPEDEALRNEVREELLAALSALSPREREAFVLRDLEGQSTAAVAAALDVGESTVRSLLTLARRRLRGVLGPRLAVTEPAS